jgi:hypothetical protein
LLSQSYLSCLNSLHISELLVTFESSLAFSTNSCNISFLDWQS